MIGKETTYIHIFVCVSVCALTVNYNKKQSER